METRRIVDIIGQSCARRCPAAQRVRPTTEQPCALFSSDLPPTSWFR